MKRQSREEFRVPGAATYLGGKKPRRRGCIRAAERGSESAQGVNSLLLGLRIHGQGPCGPAFEDGPRHHPFPRVPTGCQLHPAVAWGDPDHPDHGSLGQIRRERVHRRIHRMGRDHCPDAPRAVRFHARQTRTAAQTSTVLPISDLRSPISESGMRRAGPRSARDRGETPAEHQPAAVRSLRSKTPPVTCALCAQARPSHNAASAAAPMATSPCGKRLIGNSKKIIPATPQHADRRKKNAASVMRPWVS